MRWLYARRMGWNIEDPRIAPSDVQRLLQEQPWFRSGVSLSSFYPNVMELLDQPRELRREFLLHLLGQATNPSPGYGHLAVMLRRRWVHTVLTTNFDDPIRVAYGPGALIPVATPDQYPVITTAPQHPQIIYLHGLAEYYLDRNLPGEIEHLDANLVDRLLPLIRDHPLVVIGYRGTEPSVMNDLFLNNVERAEGYRHGIYWCMRKRNPFSLDACEPSVRELASRIGRNFTLVPITDFDGILEELRRLWEERYPEGSSRVGGSRALTASEPDQAQALPFDLRPADGRGKADLDWDRVGAQLRNYARQVGLSAPDSPSRDWCEQQLAEAGLATRAEDGLHLTNGGVLLLTNKGRRVARGAWTELCQPGRPPRAVDGTLWEQYEAALAFLTEHNRPVRMKGMRSETVQPYAEAALKEVVANALVHRDYERAEPITITALPEAIQIESPGGLEESLRRRLLGGDLRDGLQPRDLLQRRIEQGERGAALTAYRNTVLADLFYGTGIVDKVGSGLADALQAMEALGGRLLIEVAEDNSRVSAMLTRRPARVDERTGTAVPETPSIWADSNLFEVLELPLQVWSAPSPHRRLPDPKLQPEVRDWPRAVFYDGRLYSFADLTDVANPLRSLLGVGQIASQELADFAAGEVGEDRLVHLVHEVLFHHLGKCGLRTDWENKRAYYPCTRGDTRSITYRGRVLKTTRRVAWWPGQDRVFCVHKAAAFHIERYGGQWTLRISPTYVFTRDGASDRIRGTAATSLATQYMTEDYNEKVAADVFFWRAILAGDTSQIVLDAGCGSRVVLDATPAGALIAPLANSTADRATAVAVLLDAGGS